MSGKLWVVADTTVRPFWLGHRFHSARKAAVCSRLDYEGPRTRFRTRFSLAVVLVLAGGATAGAGGATQY